MSLAVCLLQRDNDANLKWPCNATVAVSVLNQLQDGQHCTSKINMYVNAPDRENGKGTGYTKFISHFVLPYHGRMNCQYVGNDAMFLRVDSIELN